MIHIRRTLQQTIREQQGSASMFGVGLTFVVILTLLPLVWNFGAIWNARRVSQNASDAATLAGAESVARQINALSQDWWGCVPPETPQTIVQRYKQQVVASVAGSGIGSGSAGSFAKANGASINGYSQRLHPMGADGVHAKMVDGVVVIPVHVDARTSSPTLGVIVTERYGGIAPLRAHATAETYLDRYWRWETPCPTNPKAIAVHYRFKWKIRLVKTDW
jgi:ABC-type phosphate transport system substrate-binding protein